MTKKEVAKIKNVISQCQQDLACCGEHMSEVDKMACTARIDVLVWLLVETGHDEGLDPELHPEDFKEPVEELGHPIPAYIV